MDYNKLTFKEKISYGLAGLGQNLTITFVNTFLMTVIYGYMGFTLKSLSILTVILIVAKVWDAVNDPIMGVLIDKIQFKNRGKLRPLILISIFDGNAFRHTSRLESKRKARNVRCCVYFVGRSIYRM